MSTEPEDASLVLAAQSGEDWAFPAIWRRYAPRVRRFFARSGRSAIHDVDDLTQEVFVRLFADHQRIRNPASLRYFIMAVAARVLHRQLRHRQITRNVLSLPMEQIPDVATYAGAEEEGREARCALARCREIIERIRAPERIAFELRYLEGRTVDQIAGRLRISRSTAKRLIHRAAKKVSMRASRTPDLSDYCFR